MHHARQPPGHKGPFNSALFDFALGRQDQQVAQTQAEHRASTSCKLCSVGKRDPDEEVCRSGPNQRNVLCVKKIPTYA